MEVGLGSSSTEQNKSSGKTLTQAAGVSFKHGNPRHGGVERAWRTNLFAFPSPQWVRDSKGCL